jgi:DNA-binding XRE family transcriptional regulator
MVDEKNLERNPKLPILKEVRERLGMTQEQIADNLGISRRTVIRHEAGERVIKLNFTQIKRLKELLEQAGMSINDLPDDIE